VLVKDYAAINRKWWNNATPAHAGSKFYDIPRFIKGKTSLQSIEIDELGKVRGKTLLHLLCHFGMDTLSWARKGAITTGVDISDSSIRLAKKLSRQTGIPSTFICSDIYELPKILDKKFDIIFASYGVLLWLSNIKKFAEIIVPQPSYEFRFSAQARNSDQGCADLAAGRDIDYHAPNRICAVIQADCISHL